jgi:UDP-N-acetylmuramate--alanine ligase
MLGEIMRMKFSIGISGTHGKTTTTSMIGSVLNAAKWNPTLIVGGIVRDLKSNAQLGKDNYAVVEADEFDRSFLVMYPSVAVVTNVEADHLDCYKDLEDIKSAFVEFCNKVPFYGCTVLCVDDPSVRSIIPRIHKAIITYGFSSEADYQAREIAYRTSGIQFKAYHHEKLIGDFNLRAPGEHNVQNSLAAIAVANELHIPVAKIIKGLAEFSGVRRRFEIKSVKQGITVVDDYAHHPTEVSATLKAAATLAPKRIVAIFQPHLYSRTRDFYKEFAKALLPADQIVITDIYPAREEPIAGITGQLIADAAKEMGHPNTVYIPDKKEIPKAVKALARSGDIIITMGAGDIYKFGEKIFKKS